MSIRNSGMSQFFIPKMEETVPLSNVPYPISREGYCLARDLILSQMIHFFICFNKNHIRVSYKSVGASLPSIKVNKLTGRFNPGVSQIN